MSKKYLNSDIKNARGYTPEPDIFHDIQGHIPLLMNKKYADFMWEIGVLGYEIVKNKRNLTPELVNHNLKRLQNFSWWTYEYGLLKNSGRTDKFRRVSNDIPYEIYGSELFLLLMKQKTLLIVQKGKRLDQNSLKYDIEEIVLTCFDYSNIQDRYFVIDSMEELYSSFSNNKNYFFMRVNGSIVIVILLF